MSERCSITVKDFSLDCGKTLPSAEFAYHTFGTLNEEKSNVVLAFHALTGNSDVLEWWSGVFGKGKIFDPKKHFIICANFIGSCYGSTGPESINPETGSEYHADFPVITIRDIARQHVAILDS